MPHRQPQARRRASRYTVSQDHVTLCKTLGVIGAGIIASERGLGQSLSYLAGKFPDDRPHCPHQGMISTKS